MTRSDDVHLRRDDAREARLAGARRAGEQQMVDGLAALARRAEQDVEVLLEPRLADELVEPARPQRRLLRGLDRIRARPQQLLPAHCAHALMP